MNVTTYTVGDRDRESAAEGALEERLERGQVLIFPRAC